MKNSRNLIYFLICASLILLVEVFGLFVIKDADLKISLREEGYRNLCQVKVYSSEKSGMGIVIGVDDDNVDILTTKHLVSDSALGEVMFGNGEKVSGEIVYLYPDYDAAILRIKREDSDQYFKGAKKPEILSKTLYENLSISRYVYYLSDYRDSQKEFRQGMWLESNAFVYEIQEEVGLFSGEVIPGMSGEGLFDEYDRLIGMIIAASDTQGAVIPAYKLENEYIKFKLSEEE